MSWVCVLSYSAVLLLLLPVVVVVLVVVLGPPEADIKSPRGMSDVSAS